MGGLPDSLLKYLSTHLQIVARRELLAMGYRRAVIHGWVRRGLLVKVERGVYSLPGLTLTFEQRVYAKVLGCGPDAAAGPRATLALNKVEGFTECPEIDVVITGDRQVAVPGCRVMDLAKIDRHRYRKVIPAMSVTRALMEVAPHVARKRIRVGFDDARRRELLSIDHTRRRATELADHPGAQLFLELVNGRAFDPESEGERGLQAFLVEALPEEQVEWQVRDLVPGRRLDAAVRRVLLGFESDSRDFHVDREPDYLRDLESAVEGVQIIRITAGMLRHHREELRDRIRTLVAQRERMLAGTAAR